MTHPNDAERAVATVADRARARREAFRREQAKPTGRVFDHLWHPPMVQSAEEAEEDAHFSRVARRMRSSAWWHLVPLRTEPAAVAGEFREGRGRLKRVVDMLAKLTRDELDAALAAMDPKKRALLVKLVRATNNQ